MERENHENGFVREILSFSQVGLKIKETLLPAKAGLLFRFRFTTPRQARGDFIEDSPLERGATSVAGCVNC